MIVDKMKYSSFLDKVAERLDIPPSKYQAAVKCYKAVGQWLEGGEYQGCMRGELDIYPQGSFRLGTVVKPMRNTKEGDYDIDLACELSIEKRHTSPCSIKTMVGNRLKEHGTYRKLITKEGKRCWTLEYAEEDGIGFHLDVLPAIPSPDPRNLNDTSIAITNKSESNYNWSASNPKGYGIWFDDRNSSVFTSMSNMQKRLILERAPNIYMDIEDVPDQLVRTPLQRSIQLMKRHRDMKFNDVHGNDYSPISIIITTLSAYFYQNEIDTFDAMRNIINRLYEHTVLIEDEAIGKCVVPHSPIRRTSNGEWHIGNPVNQKENFADRWHEDNHARAKAFFCWVESLKKDLVDITGETHRATIRERLSKTLGPAAVLPYFHLIMPDDSNPPKTHISEGAKPWRG